jgi:hypothetical protein
MSRTQFDIKNLTGKYTNQFNQMREDVYDSAMYSSVVTENQTKDKKVASLAMTKRHTSYFGGGEPLPMTMKEKQVCNPFKKIQIKSQSQLSTEQLNP